MMAIQRPGKSLELEFIKRGMSMFAKFCKDKIHVQFYPAQKNFKELVEKIKETGVYEWRPKGKYWTLRPTLEAINFLLTYDFKFPQEDLPRLEAALTKAEKLLKIKTLKWELSKCTSAPPIPGMEAYLNFTLAPFQWAACNYAGLLDEGKCWFLLADDMGTGKTLQAITVTLLPGIKPKAVLVICPAGVTYNWQKELKEKFNLDSVVIDAKFKGLTKGITYYICSYERQKKIEAMFDFLIIDEAHYIKRKATERYKSAKRHRDNATYVMALTGTPIENRPKEAYTFLSLLDPDCPTWFAFTKKYCGGEQKYIKTFNIAKNCYETKMYYDSNGASNLLELHDYLYHTCAIRRTKEQVCDQLPELTREVIDLGDEDIPGDSIFSMYKNNSDAKQSNAAFAEWLTEMLQSGQKTLVFTHHLDFQAGIARLCEELKIPYILINGSTPAKTRQELIDKFNSDPDMKVAILSITAASTGINLQTASVVIFAELYYVMTTLMQAEARAHRMGQKNAVTVYLPVFSKLEKEFLAILLEKMRIFAKAIDGQGEKDDNNDQSLLSQLSKKLGIPIGLEKVKVA
jgi:SWI/SNF-related matrix-associated actin-dependent regulator of chromatin subfamily A-like protein 1